MEIGTDKSLSEALIFASTNPLLLPLSSILQNLGKAQAFDGL